MFIMYFHKVLKGSTGYRRVSSVSPMHTDWFYTDKVKVTVCLILPDGDQLAKVQLVVINLSNKDGCHCLIESCAIHVDSGTHWENKTSDLPVHMTVFQQTLHGDRQCGRAVDRWHSNKRLIGPYSVSYLHSSVSF